MTLFTEVDFTINKEHWLDIWHKSNAMSIGDIPLPNGMTIGEARSNYGKEPRRDLVVEFEHDSPHVKELFAAIREKWGDISIGRVSLFLQKKGEDVPLHSDVPYRTGSMLMAPIFGTATTYYADPYTETVIKTPVILDVVSKHGVKDITTDRLALHVEFPLSTVADFI